MKVFPRNLTARADQVVRGNPASTRPESGVDNCFPGLEFDQRNLDKAFFPGLLFEFHGDDGAVLRALAADSPPTHAGLAEADLTPALYLWAVAGRTGAGAAPDGDDELPLQAFDGLAGLDAWRRVHDLAPGRVAILLGPEPGRGVQIPAAALAATASALTKGRPTVRRGAGGELRWAALVGDRAVYVSPDTGVIDVEAYAPGDLTRSLCVPWQYDFRDCGCFYWASNKPDLVTAAGGDTQVNFQRRDRTAGDGDVPPADLETWNAVRRQQELDYAELVGGAWNELPVVLDDTESDQFVPRGEPKPKRLMTPEEVTAELEYLAGVEHALSVEYLFAHYSVDAPFLPAEGVREDLPENDVSLQPPQPLPEMDRTTARIFAAAHEVLRVAVDEMRHLHWVNQLLAILGRPPVVGRAGVIGRQQQRPFALHPLTPEQLQWFIDIEQPSQAVDEGIDGMYVWLLDSVTQQAAEFREADRIAEILKLIIDEGGGHYARFVAVRDHLHGLAPKRYLREMADTPPSDELAATLTLSDESYRVVLGHLDLSFRLGVRSGGALLEQARRAMFSMHELNHALASRGVAPRFALPASLPALPADPVRAAVAGAGVAPPPATAMMAALDDLSAGMERALAAVEAAGDGGLRELAGRQRQRSAALFAESRRLVGEAAAER